MSGRHVHKHRHGAVPGHGHRHGLAPLLGDPDPSAAGLRVLVISLAALGITAGLQVGVVALSGSAALLADTVHNFADALTAIPLGVAFVLGRRRPTRHYPYGYGRCEDVAGVVIVAVIAVSAALTAWYAVDRLLDPRAVHGAGWVAAAGLVGFAGNELVARYRIRGGRQIGSAALVADGLHARADGLTSLAVVGAAMGSVAGWRLADPVMGLVIGATIVNVLRLAGRDVFRRLMDGVDPGLLAHVRSHLEAAPGIRRIDRVRVRWTGHQLHVDADVVLDAHIDLTVAHAILEEARHRLFHKIPRLADALLHASPDLPGGDAHAVTRHHLA